jgi:tripartite-type tricarboxylate transporter receptor subunit TctC
MKMIGVLLWLAAAAAQAQGYPGRAINVVIPLAAGDAADMAARTMGDELAKTLRTPIVAVNRPGAGGVVAAESVAKAQKDGYTILFAQNSPLTFRPVLDAQTVPYDPRKDLLPLGLASRTPSVLVVRGDAPYRSFRELVDYAKKNPGAVRVGTPGSGSVGDFCIQLINALTDAQLTSVPFNGASPAITALRGGHIEGVVMALGAVSAHIKSGAFRGLAISSRFPELPDIPTMTDLGYSQNLFGIWIAFFAPAGVPPEVASTLVPAIEQAVRSPAVSARLLPLGIVQDYASPDKLAAEIREEFQAVQAVAKKSGLVK